MNENKCDCGEAIGGDECKPGCASLLPPSPTTNATGRPWIQEHRTVCSKEFGLTVAVTQVVSGGLGTFTNPINTHEITEAEALANARLIVESVNSHAALLKEIEGLKAELEAARGALKKIGDVGYDGRCTECSCVVAPEGYCGCNTDSFNEKHYVAVITARLALRPTATGEAGEGDRK